MIEYENLVHPKNVQMAKPEVAVIRASHNDFYVTGQGVSVFENELAKYIGFKCCIDVVNDLDTSIRATRKFLNSAISRPFLQA